MNDERKINVVIADISFPITVKSERDEELVRKAANKVNDMLNTYRSKYVNESKERWLAMIALHSVYNELLQLERNDTDPFKQKMQELTREMEEFLRKD
jgi:cell division protein ZapA